MVVAHSVASWARAGHRGVHVTGQGGGDLGERPAGHRVAIDDMPTALPTADR
jgi:hypothetical protein